MKAILCGKCHDFKALPAAAFQPVVCRCQNVTGWWTSPQRGTMEVFAQDREFARVIGLNNAWLYAGFCGIETDEQWRELQEGEARRSLGYLFHQSLRNHQAVIIRPGQTGDVAWAEALPPSVLSAGVGG